MGHGHFGAKLHRLRDGRWEEIGVPKWPQKPDGPPDKDLPLIYAVRFAA